MRRTMMTSAPRAVRRRASSRPMPEDAPLMSTSEPSSTTYTEAPTRSAISGAAHQARPSLGGERGGAPRGDAERPCRAATWPSPAGRTRAASCLIDD